MIFRGPFQPKSLCDPVISPNINLLFSFSTAFIATFIPTRYQQCPVLFPLPPSCWDVSFCRWWPVDFLEGVSAQPLLLPYELCTWTEVTLCPR